MFASRLWWGGALVLVATLAGACAVGPGAGDRGQVTVTMQQTSHGFFTPAVNGWYASVAGNESVFINQDDVDELTVTITEIQFLPVSEEGVDAPWESLPLGEDVELNLMALPTEGESPIVIASGDVPVGDYRMLRLLVTGGNIVFNTETALGRAITFEAGDPGHAVTIPSGMETGIKTDAEFSVVADTDVNILFDPAATFLNVAVTGNGQVILAPVIRALLEE